MAVSTGPPIIAVPDGAFADQEAVSSLGIPECPQYISGHAAVFTDREEPVRGGRGATVCFVDQEPAYRSWLTLTTITDQDAAWPHGPWQSTSAVTDAVDPELAELRRRIVDPVVEAVLIADELESVVVFEERTGHEVRATVVARGETSYHYLHMQRSLPAAGEELAGMAAQFASELEDFRSGKRFRLGGATRRPIRDSASMIRYISRHDADYSIFARSRA